MTILSLSKQYCIFNYRDFLKQLIDISYLYVNYVRDVNNIMVNNCASGHQCDTDMDTSIPISSQQIILGAMVLQIIRDMDELTFSELKIKIGESARKTGLSEDKGVRAIYTLLANQLITIDRSKGSYQPVRSDLLI